MIDHERGEWRRVPLALYWEPGIASETVDLIGPVTIGRRRTCDVALLGDGRVSRAHCRIELYEHGWFVRDSGSTAGTRVDGCETPWGPLIPGARILVGDTVLHVLERIPIAIAA